MNLKEFKDYIESFPVEAIFNYSISEPFSWRGSYNEVAFAIDDSSMSRELMLEYIERAYTETFTGYKGGEYRYDDYTDIHYEESYSCCTSGDYTSEWIARIEGNEAYKSIEERLIKIAFN